MAFYPQAAGLPLGTVLREGLDDLRSSRFKLAHVLGTAAQMTDQQFADAFGFDISQASAAKAEIQADAGKFLNGDAGVTCAEMNAAVAQMLDQFG